MSSVAKSDRSLSLHGNAVSNYQLGIDRLLMVNYEKKLRYLKGIETKRGVLNPSRRTGKLNLARYRKKTSTKAAELGLLREADLQAIRDIRAGARKYAGKEKRHLRAAKWACEEFSSPSVMVEFPYFLDPPPFQGEAFTLESAWKRVESARKVCERHPRYPSDDPADFAPGSEAETTLYRDCGLTYLLFMVLRLEPFADLRRIVPPKPRRDRRTVKLTGARLTNRAGVDSPSKPKKVSAFCQKHGFDEKIDGKEDAASRWLGEQLKP